MKSSKGILFSIILIGALLCTATTASATSEYQFGAVTPVKLLTSGASADLVTFSVTDGAYVPLFLFMNLQTLSGDPSAATFELRTGPNGTGVALNTASSTHLQSSVTAGNCVPVIVPAVRQGAGYTGTLVQHSTVQTLYLRQVTNSANSATFSGTLVLLGVP
jgi:hypothetical protein